MGAIRCLGLFSLDSVRIIEAPGGQMRDIKDRNPVSLAQASCRLGRRFHIRVLCVEVEILADTRYVCSLRPPTSPIVCHSKDDPAELTIDHFSRRKYLEVCSADGSAGALEFFGPLTAEREGRGESSADLLAGVAGYGLGHDDKVCHNLRK